MLRKMKRKYVVNVFDEVDCPEYECTERFAYNGGYVFEYINDKGLKDFVLVPRGYQFGDVEVELFKKIKAAFDPLNLLNPGKIF